MITKLNLPQHLEILLTTTDILMTLERDVLHYFLVFQDSGAMGFGGKCPKIHVAMLNNRITFQKYLTLITLLFYSITIYHNSTIASFCSCKVPRLDSIELWDEKPQRLEINGTCWLHSQTCHNSFIFLKDFFKKNVFQR